MSFFRDVDNEPFPKARAVFDAAVKAGRTNPTAVQQMLSYLQKGRFSEDHYVQLWKRKGVVVDEAAFDAPVPLAAARQEEPRKKKVRRKKIRGVRGETAHDMSKDAMGRMIDHLVARKANLTKMFAMVDIDGSGDIDDKELRLALHNIGMRLTPKEAKEIMDVFDADGNGTVDLEEFLIIFKRERAQRFDGYVPELKDAKTTVTDKLRIARSQGDMRGASEAYRKLQQIEQLQRTRNPPPEIAAQMRRKMRELLSRDMQMNAEDTRALRRLSREANANANADGSETRAQWEQARLWKRDTADICGPKMADPQRRTRSRLSLQPLRGGRSNGSQWGARSSGVHAFRPRPREASDRSLDRSISAFGLRGSGNDNASGADGLPDVRASGQGLFSQQSMPALQGARFSTVDSTNQVGRPSLRSKELRSWLQFGNTMSAVLGKRAS